MPRGMNTIMRIVSIAVLGVATGTLASLAAIAFVELIAVLNQWLLISPRSRFMAGDTWWLLLATICVPAVGGLVVGILNRYIAAAQNRKSALLDQGPQSADDRRRVPVFLPAGRSLRRQPRGERTLADLDPYRFAQRMQLAHLALCQAALVDPFR